MIVSTLCRLLLPLAVGLLAVSGTAPAFAIEDEWTVGGGATLASIPTEEAGIMGFGASVLCRYAVTDTLAISLSGQYSVHVPTPSATQDPATEPGWAHIGVPRLGLRYAIDIIDIVPYLALDGAAYFGDTSAFAGEGWSSAFGVVGGAGLEYFIGANLYLAWHSDPF
jgi:hypothetical protein